MSLSKLTGFFNSSLDVAVIQVNYNEDNKGFLLEISKGDFSKKLEGESDTLKENATEFIKESPEVAIIHVIKRPGAEKFRLGVDLFTQDQNKCDQFNQFWERDLTTDNLENFECVKKVNEGCIKATLLMALTQDEMLKTKRPGFCSRLITFFKTHRI